MVKLLFPSDAASKAISLVSDSSDNNKFQRSWMNGQEEDWKLKKAFWTPFAYNNAWEEEVDDVFYVLNFPDPSKIDWRQMIEEETFKDFLIGAKNTTKGLEWVGDIDYISDPYEYIFDILVFCEWPLDENAYAVPRKLQAFEPYARQMMYDFPELFVGLKCGPEYYCEAINCGVADIYESQSWLKFLEFKGEYYDDNSSTSAFALLINCKKTSNNFGRVGVYQYREESSGFSIFDGDREIIDDLIDIDQYEWVETWYFKFNEDECEIDFKEYWKALKLDMERKVWAVKIIEDAAINFLYSPNDGKMFLKARQSFNANVVQ